MKRLLLSIVVVLGALSTDARASSMNEIGVWKLVSMVFVEEGTGASSSNFGEHPKGYLMFTPGGHMAVVINAEGREPASTKPDQRTHDQAKLFSSMTAHAGSYRITDGKLVHQVEVAHDPSMLSGELIRYMKPLGDDRMESTTPIRDFGDSKRGKVVLTWQRVE